MVELIDRNKINGLESELMQALYPDIAERGVLNHILAPQYSLDDVILRPGYSGIIPNKVSLCASIGSVKLNLPLLSAPMDTVTGADLAKVLFEVGGCGIIYRHPRADIQLKWLKESLAHQPCLVKNLRMLKPSDVIDDVQGILSDGFSTIPVVENGKLKGILFTKNVSIKEHLEDPVSKWMTPVRKLKKVKSSTSFTKVRSRLLHEPGCSVLPVVNDDFKGLYFRKDCRPANPSYHNNKPLVGMAVSPRIEDLERVRVALKMGAGIIVIDSSHGDCDEVFKISEEIVKLAKGPNGQAAVLVGNVGSIGGYLRLAAIGVDGVKLGIGPGSICTTTSGTGVGTMMFSVICECSSARNDLIKNGLHAPVIIADGGINNTGHIVKALAAGAQLCMAGKFFAQAKESIPAMRDDVKKGDWTAYRGMGSKGAIKNRSVRYDKGKKAPEGVAGYVQCRGPLKSWIGESIELVHGGLAHVGASNIVELQKYASQQFTWSLVTNVGTNQIATRVNMGDD